VTTPSFHLSKRHWLAASSRLALGGIAAASLAGCGFQLRGAASYQYAFDSVFSGFSPGSSLGQDFKRIAIAWGLKVYDDAAGASKAQVVLRIHSEQREKVVVGTGIAGQVREFQLRIRLKFSLFTTGGKLLIDEVEILQQREVSYSESAALAKEAEEQLLYRDMQQEVVLQLLRRMAAIKTLSTT
jgi:LPS-assembly lipoprotein